MASRRGSVQPAARRRLSSKDTTTTKAFGDVQLIKDGDIFYKTVKSFPAFPDSEDEVVVTVTRPIDPSQIGQQKDNPASLTFGRRSAADRRGSVLPGSNREEVTTEDPGSNRERAASIAASVGGDNKRRGVVIWPEWSDGDINAEKWDASHKPAGKAEKKQSPALVAQHYDDPDGKVEMPPCLRVHSWKRPQDFITDKMPTVVDPEGMNSFDLLSANEASNESELMRWVTGQIIALWNQSQIKVPEGGGPIDPNNSNEGETAHTWRPWELIYAINKIPNKGTNFPAYNPHGKYVVRLYWMGSWRKITVDDTMPFDENERLLLPATTLQHELWPMILTKALIKVASLDYNGGSPSCEFGDFSPISCMTGYLPETIPLQVGYLAEVWKLLQSSLPEFKLPEPKPEEPAEGEALVGEEATRDSVPGESGGKIGQEKPDAKPKKEDKKDKKDDKKDKKDKDKGKEDKGKEKAAVPEEQPLPEHPEVMVFASYSGPPKFPMRMSLLGEIADASERLRQKGLSHLYPHPVLIKQTRACPLEPPPPPEKIPAWKLIRPKKKKTTPSDEPVEQEEKVEKPIQCVEITSPFINYKVSPVPIPTDVHRPKSSLERGCSRVSSRPGTANHAVIEETDENAPEPEVPPPASVDKIKEVKEVKEDLEEVKTESDKPGTGGKKQKKQPPPGSGAKAPKDEAVSPKVEKKPPTPVKNGPGQKRQSSATGPREKVAPNAAADTKPVKGTESKEAKATDVKAKDSKESGVTAKDVEVSPLDGTPLEGEEENTGEEGALVAEEEKPKAETRSEDMWMDFEEFCKCFKTLYIYHKPYTYPKNHKHSDLKTAVNPASHKEKGSKHTAGQALPGQVTDDKAPHYLFVDNLQPTEIVVSFSSLSRWPEPPSSGPAKEESKMNLKKEKSSDRDSKADIVTESSSVIEMPSEPKLPEPIQPGLLVAEPYSWKSLVSGQPIMRLRTTGIKTAVLTLPAGRHVLRFNMTSPLGYHIHLVSSVQFVFGDEELVMAELTKESCRFVDNATQVITTLGKCIQAFLDPEQFKLAWEDYTNAHCPYRNDKLSSKQHHHKMYKDAFYQTLKKVLGEANLLTPEMATAWKAFCFDVTTKNPLGLSYGTQSRPGTSTGVTTSDRGSATKSKASKRREQPDHNPKLDHWKNREITPEEHVAAVKIQKGWRGCWVRKIQACRTPGTEDNAKTHEQLTKAWAVFEPQAEQMGLQLFRILFKADPDLMPKYPFYKDEWNKISYADYQGSHPDQPQNTWFVVFRDIFHVSEEMLLVPKMYVPIHTCMLRVINNDTGEEMPRVFFKVAPAMYKKNKKGYTFMAEARTLEQPLQAGRWRMRLIGSLSQLPAPLRAPEMNCSFFTREIRDYYVPNEKNIALRYSVKVVEDHLVSIQLQTSKPDVYIRLSILDNEEEQIATVGKGHVVIPSYIFHKDPGTSESGRSGSRGSNKGDKKGEKSKKRSGSTGEGRVSRTSSRRSLCSTDDEEERDTKPHKYIIQAVVLRESWPLSESQWQFVQVLKEMEKNELKVSYKERPASAMKAPAATVNTAPSNAKSKDAKSKTAKGKDKDKNSRPPSQQFDLSKPNWTMRVVSDGASAEEIEVKKDTERADEIRAMKKAWEDADPGRAAKAAQSRLQYLNSHMVKVGGDEEKQEEPAKEEGETIAPAQEVAPQPSPTPALNLESLENDTNFTLVPPPPPPAKEVLRELDITPYLRSTGRPPRLLDDTEVQRQVEAKQAEIAAYRAWRADVERRREEDRQARNTAKIQQIQMCEQMQAALDSAREAINAPREAFRQKFLEAERKRLEEIAAQEAALRAETEKAPSPKGKKASAKGKKSPGGKKKK